MPLRQSAWGHQAKEAPRSTQHKSSNESVCTTRTTNPHIHTHTHEIFKAAQRLGCRGVLRQASVQQLPHSRCRCVPQGHIWRTTGTGTVCKLRTNLRVWVWVRQPQCLGESDLSRSLLWHHSALHAPNSHGTTTPTRSANRMRADFSRPLQPRHARRRVTLPLSSTAQHGRRTLSYHNSSA